MAKKEKATAAKERRDLTKFSAFWSIGISAILYIASGIMSFIIWLGNDKMDEQVKGSMGTASGIMTFIGNILIIIALGLPAYGYVKGKSKGWKIFYWISIAIFALGIVFGFLPSF